MKMPGKHFVQSFSSYILAMMLAVNSVQVLAEDTDLKKDKTYKACCPGWCCPLNKPDYKDATNSGSKGGSNKYEKSKSCCPGTCCSDHERKDKRKMDKIEQKK